MKARYSIALLLLAALVNLGVMKFQAVPGYMDAEYYSLGGRQLAAGAGFNGDILWHYLDDPSGLPHLSHGYWMPFGSFVAAAGMMLAGSDGFLAARLVFFAIAILVPWATARLSYELNGKPGWALASGMLAIFSGFYLPYMTTTDTFALYMLLGAGIFLVLPRAARGSYRDALLAGLLVGGLHLARVDGILWLPVILWGLMRGEDGKRRLRPSLAMAVVGYLVVMGPWFVRNLLVWGSPFGAGGSRTLWLTSYDQIFSYPAAGLTMENWLRSGWRAIWAARGWALGINVQRIVVEQGGILLFPLMVVGLWQHRKRVQVQVGVGAWMMVVGLMTVVFPFAGARGGLFHAGAATLPLFWAVTPSGLDQFLQWGRRKRGWQPEQAGRIFGIAGIVMMAGLSLVVVSQKVIGPDASRPAWGRSARHYRQVDVWLRAKGASSQDVVMVKDPPGYALENGRQAVVIPDGGYEAMMAVARRYGAGYVLLEADHSRGLDRLYQDPGGEWPGITYLGEVDGTMIFEVVGAK